MKGIFNDEFVRMRHGAGGPAMRALIESVFLGASADPEALALDDGAAIPFGDQFLVITTDAHVIQPIFFPGGDIGRLAISGVVNDLAVMGAFDVLALTSSVILEEGFPVERLRRVRASMQAACDEAGAKILTGDTKVMGRGEVDGLVMSTTGLGVTRRVIRGNGMRPGDAVLVTGTLGDHGLAVMSARHGLGLEGALLSDVAPLNGLLRAAVAVGGEAVHAMKDPTRGGAIGALCELAEHSGVGVILDAASLPYSDAARAAGELLGIDPLSIANEGKALLSVAPEAADAVLAALRAHPLGVNAARIGRVVEEPRGTLLLDTGFGRRRLVERDGEPLPRIC